MLTSQSMCTCTSPAPPPSPAAPILCCLPISSAAAHSPPGRTSLCGLCGAAPALLHQPAPVSGGGLNHDGRAARSTIDVYLNFVTGYEDEDGDTVTNMRLIAQNYLRTWFIIDLLAILPVELILDGTEGRLACNFTGEECEESGGQSASMLKMFKVLRLLR